MGKIEMRAQELLDRYDGKNGGQADGVLTQEEAPFLVTDDGVKIYFSVLDADGSGYVDKNELEMFVTNDKYNEQMLPGNGESLGMSAVMRAFLELQSEMDDYYRQAKVLKLKDAQAAYKKIKETCYEMALTSMICAVAFAVPTFAMGTYQLRSVANDLKKFNKFIESVDFDKLKTNKAYRQKITSEIERRGGKIQEAFREWLDAQPGQPGKATAVYSRQSDAASGGTTQELFDGWQRSVSKPKEGDPHKAAAAEAKYKKVEGEEQAKVTTETQAQQTRYQIFTMYMSSVMNMGQGVEQSQNAEGEGDKASHQSDATVSEKERDDADQDKERWNSSAKQFVQIWNAVMSGDAQALYDILSRF